MVGGFPKGEMAGHGHHDGEVFPFAKFFEFTVRGGPWNYLISEAPNRVSEFRFRL